MAGTTATLLLSNTSAQAAEKQSEIEEAKLKQPVDDPWAAFSEEISRQEVTSKTWPDNGESNSPLRSPAYGGQSQATDMQDAINRAKNKRQIDPRTHG